MGKKRKAKSRPGQARGKAVAAAALERWLELAVSANERGAFGEARTYFRKITAKDPSRAPVWHALAGACYQLGDVAEAITALERACEIEPGNVEYLNDLGGLYLAAGSLAAAERTLKAVVAGDPEYGQAQYNLASVLYQLGNVPGAIAELDRLLARDPGFAEAQFNLGIALRDIGNFPAAISAFRAARKLQPENARTYLEIGRLEADAHLAESAVRQYREYLKRVPDDAAAIVELGELLHRDGRTEEAIGLLEQASRERQDLGQIPLSLAGILHNAGRLGAAEATYVSVLERFPQEASAAVGLSRLRRFTDPRDPVLEILTTSLEPAGVTDDRSEPVHFALGKIHDDLGNYDEAFAHYSAGNALRARSVNYDRAAVEKQTDELIEVFAAPVGGEPGPGRSTSEKPVLIVGMPRSGTTLTEQIVAAHAAVAGAGELAYFSALARNLPLLAGSGVEYPASWADVDDALREQMIAQYLALLDRHGPGAARVTDKMPVNYRHVGLFLSLFPRARVVICRREPRDVALSIYFQYFRERHDYAWNLRDIAHCYVQHERLLRHWLSVAPANLHEVAYADLVTDFERTARSLIDAVGLAWDPQCLEFHRVERDVKTASNWQVRQPLYASSLERWRRYAPFLDGFAETLESERLRYGLVSP